MGIPEAGRRPRSDRRRALSKVCTASRRDLRNRRVDAGVPEVRAPARSACPALPARRHRRTAPRTVQREPVAGVRPREHVEHQRRVGDGSRDRAFGYEQLERSGRRVRHTSVRRLQTRRRRRARPGSGSSRPRRRPGPAAPSRIATAAAAPPLDPPAVRAGSNGLRAGPLTVVAGVALPAELRHRRSCRAARRPPSRSRSTSGASTSGTQSANSREPMVVRTPAVGTTSLTDTGTPHSAGAPLRAHTRARRPARRPAPRSAVTVTNALSAGIEILDPIEHGLRHLDRRQRRAAVAGDQLGGAEPDEVAHDSAVPDSSNRCSSSRSSTRPTFAPSVGRSAAPNQHPHELAADPDHDHGVAAEALEQLHLATARRRRPASVRPHRDEDARRGRAGLRRRGR